MSDKEERAAARKDAQIRAAKAAAIQQEKSEQAARIAKAVAETNAAARNFKNSSLRNKKKR